MDTEQALAFLRAHQPMPPDDEISDDECDQYSTLLKHFRDNPDPRCLPLLINSVSQRTGMGMYEDIKFVLLAHDVSEVVPHIAHGLTHGDDGIKYRCCWWAADMNAWDLADLIRPLTSGSDEDVCDAAEAFLELREELG